MRFRGIAVAGLMACAAVPPALASEGGSAGGALISPHIGTIFWTLLTFILLAILLGRFAWKPLLGALDEREKSIQSSIDEARTDREEAEGLLREQRELLDQARRERAEAVAEGQRDAERLKSEILDEARGQRERLLEQTESQVQASLRQAQAELRGVAADLAVRAAGKLLAANLDDAAQRKLVEEYLTDLETPGDSGSPPS